MRNNSYPSSLKKSRQQQQEEEQQEEDVFSNSNDNGDGDEDENEQMINDLSSSFYSNSNKGVRKPNVIPSNSNNNNNSNKRPNNSNNMKSTSSHQMNTSQTNASIIQHLNTYNISSVFSSNGSSNNDSNNNNSVQQLAHLNILLIGEKGAGKSSLLSTFHRALHQNYGLLPVAGVGSTRTMSFTKKKKGYFLNTCHTIKGYDTRGLESLLKEEIEQFRAVRDGRALDDVEIVQKPYSSWTLWDHLYAIMSRNPAAILDPSCLNEHGKGESLIDVPHCVIFVIPANQRKVPTELEDFVNLFVEYGYQPLFAVTKIDCHGAEEGDLYAATHLYDCKKEELINTFDLAFDKVKPIQNYTQWDKREVSVENLALDLLSRAVEVAEGFVQNWEEKKMRGRGGWSSWRDELCHIM